MSSSFRRTTTFTFELIPLGKVWTPLSPQLWIELYHCCSSTRMALVLNKPRRLILLYSHLQHHNNTIIKTQEDFFIKIYTSHFIVRVRKGLLNVCMWEGVGDRTETAIFWPHSYGRQCCVFLVLMLNRRPRGPALCWMIAFFTASYQHLLWTQSGAPSPFGPVWLSLPHLVYNSVSNSN